MKKVGICACYDTHNYGSMLQSLATQVAVTNLEYENEFIIYKKKKTLGFIIKQIPRLFNKNLMSDKYMVLKKRLDLGRHKDVQAQEKVRDAAFRRFQKKYYHDFSTPYIGYDELKRGALNYQTVIVGSDQLWTPGGLGSNFYNLMFVRDEIKKISYATSFGVSQIPRTQIKKTREYLNRIDFLSVREVRGAELIKEISGRNAKVVADPTLLLSRKEWEAIIPPKRIIEEHYIFCYFLGNNEKHRDFAEDLSMKTGLRVVTTPHLDNFVERDLSFGDIQVYDIGPDDFVNLIRFADCVLTDSFHGSVFSIINNKQFLVLNRFAEGTQSRNSRIDSLCSIFNLSSRRYSKGDIFEKMKNEIDYNDVNQKLELLRKDSLSFLNDALNA